MSDSAKAVFLSYASQDAEAAKRIADALRAAGVEVWFDQSELVGGDQWDQKIRGQIGSCGLFLPLISANTQARLEGYFRLEWKLAAQRTHTMADEKAFLLPVLIDGTRDAEAKVPAEFKAVQWTKLPGGETPAGFAERVKKLLGGLEMEAGRPRPAERGESPAPPSVKSMPRWVRPVLASAVVVAIVLAVTLTGRVGREVAAKPPALSPSAPAASETFSPARQLANKALAVTTSSATGPELSAGIKEAERATTMDDLDGEVWAISALVDLSAYEMYWDHSEPRRDAIRAKIVKAKGLAPRAPLTRYAESKSLIRLDPTPDSLTVALEMLQALRAEHPSEPDEALILGLIGIAQQGQGHYEDAGRTLEQAGMGWANASSWAYLLGGNLPQALAMAKRQASVDPVPGRLQEAVVQVGRGDLAALQSILDGLPVAARVGEIPMSMAIAMAYLHRDADALLAAARRYPQPFFNRPTLLVSARGYYVGQAYAWLGRPEAARAEWIEALRLVEERQVADSLSGALRIAHMFLLVRLGRNEDVARELKLFRQQIHDFSTGPAVVALLTALGRPDEALDEMEQSLGSDLKNRWYDHTGFRYDPAYDPLRGTPRFQKLLRDTLLPGALPFDDAAPEVKR